MPPERLDTDLFDYPLPSHLIAQTPLDEREKSRLLFLHRKSGEISHHSFSDLPSLLKEGDLLVVNDARVSRAKLTGKKETGGNAEILFIRKVSRGNGREEWEALVKARGRKVPGSRFVFHGLQVEIVNALPQGRFLVRALSEKGVEEHLEERGILPLPPYIKRPHGPDSSDLARYQTIFAQAPGAVAAPTAGLHFSHGLLKRLKDKGVAISSITLMVGPGSFLPVREKEATRHRLLPEEVTLPEETVRAIEKVNGKGGRVVAVGTTVVRALEGALTDGSLRPWKGMTDLYILPGFSFRVVDGLVTNFHLPRTTLLMLVCAFGGRERVLSAYREASERCYRFYSYGDAMLIL